MAQALRETCPDTPRKPGKSVPWLQMTSTKNKYGIIFSFIIYFDSLWFYPRNDGLCWNTACWLSFRYGRNLFPGVQRSVKKKRILQLHNFVQEFLKRLCTNPLPSLRQSTQRFQYTSPPGKQFVFFRRRQETACFHRPPTSSQSARGPQKQKNFTVRHSRKTRG